MKMTVNVRGELVQREVSHVESGRDGLRRLIPITHRSERVVHIVGSDIPTIIDLGAGYSASRDSKYGDARFNKPWDRIV